MITIGDMIGTCPLEDWRNPPVIGMYNQITKQKCKEFDIPLIDTNDIMGMIWDRAEDWCHYRDISSDIEIMYNFDRFFA